MVLLVAGTALGILSGLLAFVLQFKLPLWERLAGFSALAPEYRAKVDQEKLRRRLSVIFWFVALGFLGGTIAVAIKTLTPELALPLFVALIALAFDATLVVWRIHDRNERDPAARRGSRVLVALAHAFFAFLIVFLAW